MVQIASLSLSATQSTAGLVDQMPIETALRHPIPAQKVPKLTGRVSFATCGASEGCRGYPDTPRSPKAFLRV